MKITRGATRIVVLAGRWAFKVPNFWSWRLFLHGLLANMREADWAAVGHPWLCPVLWSVPGGWLAVQRRAVPLTQAEFDAAERGLRRREDVCAELCMLEYKASSFGWLDGLIVAVDYG